MTIERVLPQILEHVDIERWQRPAAILQLLATLAPWPPGPVELRRDDRAKMLDRTEDQARYDHRVMLELRRRRVLLRWKGEGRQGDCWRINPDIRHWTKVPWTTPKRVVVAQVEAFLRATDRASGPLRGEIAGESDRRGVNEPRASAVGPKREWGSDRPSTVWDRPSMVRPERGSGDRSPHNGSDSIASSQLPLGSINRTLPLPSKGQRQREGAQRIEHSREALALMAAVRAGMRLPRLWGRGETAIAQLADDHPDQILQLIDLAANTLDGMAHPTAAARKLREALVVASSTLVDPNARIARLRELIATSEELEDFEGADRLRTELHDLERA